MSSPRESQTIDPNIGGAGGDHPQQTWQNAYYLSTTIDARKSQIYENIHSPSRNLTDFHETQVTKYRDAASYVDYDLPPTGREGQQAIPAARATNQSFLERLETESCCQKEDN